MGAITLKRSDLLKWSVTIKDRAKYKSVKAGWHDKAKAEGKTEKAGDGPDGLGLLGAFF